MIARRLPGGKPGERGVVVVMVLIIVAGIAFVGYEAMRLTRLDLTGSAVMRTRLADEGLLDAGLSLAVQVLGEDANSWDGPLDNWNYLPERSEALSLYFTSGEVTGVVEDESARFPINMLPQHSLYEDGPYGLLKRLLGVLVMAHGLSGNGDTLAAELRNWVTGGTSPLDAKYRALPTKITVPHRPMESLDELLLLQWPGAGKKDLEKLYYGTDTVPGLKDLMTVFSTGPINLNTADKLILYAALTGDDMALKMRFVSQALNYRANPQNPLGWPWYTNIAKNIKLEGQSFFSSVYGTQSTVFRVLLTAKVGLGARHALAIVERKKGAISVLRKVY